MTLVEQLRKLSAENSAPRDCIDEAADVIENLTALINRLCRQINKVSPRNDVAVKAAQYMHRNNLMMVSLLRDDEGVAMVMDMIRNTDDEPLPMDEAGTLRIELHNARFDHRCRVELLKNGAAEEIARQVEISNNFAEQIRRQNGHIAHLNRLVDEYLAAPEGWQLVPIEPTAEMLEAAYMEIGSYDQYKAMLNAAPKGTP